MWQNGTGSEDTHDLSSGVNWVNWAVRDVGHGRAPCLPSSLPSPSLEQLEQWANYDCSDSGRRWSMQERTCVPVCPDSD